MLRRIVARPSRTARAIATARAVGTDHVHDPVAAAALPARDGALAAALHARVARHRAVDRAVRLATGGLTTHAVARMVAIDRAVTDAVAAGCDQVVLVGAGFDTRAWRLDGLAGTTVWEVDRPAIQMAKRARLHGRDARTEVRLVPADLAEEDLGAVLTAAGHQAQRPTMWVWEAVIMYLPPTAVAQTLAAIADRSAPGSHLAATYLVPELVAAPAVGRLVTPLARGVFAAGGEPLRTMLSDERIREVLADAGFTVRRLGGLHELAGPARPRRLDLFAAERLVVAVATGRP